MFLIDAIIIGTKSVTYPQNQGSWLPTPMGFSSFLFIIYSLTRLLHKMFDLIFLIGNFRLSEIMHIDSAKACIFQFQNIPIKFMCLNNFVKLNSISSRKMGYGSFPETFGWWIIFQLSKRNFMLISVKIKPIVCCSILTFRKSGIKVELFE